MADGVRITQAGSAQRRITQAGDRRITERAGLAGAVLSITPGITAQAARTRYASTTLSVDPGITVGVGARRRRHAAVAVSSAPHLTSAGRAERPGSTALQAQTQFFGATGRTRAACVCLNTTTDMQAAVNRRRPVIADMTVQTVPADVFATKTVPVALHLAADTTLTAGRDDPLIRRITEAGEVRRTQFGRIRIIAENPTWGDIVVVRPDYRIYTKWHGLWHALAPHVKHAGQWQTPIKIFPKDGGLWLPVRSHLQE